MNSIVDHPLFYPAASIATGLALGLLLELIVMGQLRALAAKRQWKNAAAIVGALRGLTFAWLFLFGVRAAIETLPHSLPHLNFLKLAVGTLFIVSIAIAAMRLSHAWIEAVSHKSAGVLPATSLFSNLTRIVIGAIALLVISQNLGVPIAPVLTALGVGGLAVALALQDTLSNLFAGIHILMTGMIHVGDYVKLDSGDEGYVTDITLRNTTLRTRSNNLVIVPNSKVASAIVTNFNRPVREISVPVAVGVAYDSDLEKVERVALEVAKEVMDRLCGPGVTPPSLRFNAFADSSVNFDVFLRVLEMPKMTEVRSEYIKALHRRFIAEGIEIPFPIRTVIHKNARPAAGQG